MKVIEITGKTVEDAVKNASEELKVTKDRLEIKIIDEGNKGIFNFIGVRPAKISVTVKKDYISEAKQFLTEILASMDIKADIRIQDSDESLKISLTGPDMGILIGYRGETLDALQYLVSLVVNKKHGEEYKRVTLDTENYRVKREETLKRLARRIADKVNRTGKSVKLEPMNPYERRIIHSELQNDFNVETHSEGEEPYRKVVVDLKKA
jgi:spoIIIJ-associated protein